MNMKAYAMPSLLAIILGGILLGCDGRKERPQVVNRILTSDEQPVTSGGRFQVKQVQTFPDDLAYNESRAIYVIKDLDTGKEYIGVSGIGISELGAHAAGKNVVRDER